MNLRANLKTKIQMFLRRIGFEVDRVGNVDILPTLIAHNWHPGFFFIQIGANDGRRYDPIFRLVKSFGIAGLAVEPIKDYFRDLEINYKGSKVIPVNKAIYFRKGKVLINRAIDSKELPEWAKGIASIDPEHHKKSGIDSRFIAQEEVEAITFNDLLDEYGIRSVDLIQIDVEGFDKEIIKMIPFDRISPKIIQFEHGLPNNVMSKADFLEILSLLIDKGYKIAMKEYDCIAYK